MSTLTETIIAAERLSYKSGQRYLIKDIDWQIARGRHWAVFGANGCGKTTLLSIIAGFKPLTSGRLTVFGEAYSADNIFAIRRRIGWVSSSFFDGYYGREPALDIVLSGLFGRFGLEYGVKNGDVQRAKALLAAVGLGTRMHQPFHLMSKGERQNVLIARALICRPEILVLDEPCSGLDVLARARVMALVRALAEHSQLTMIYVTHYTEEILPDVFGQTLLLKNGCAFAQGATAELFNAELLGRFLDYPVSLRETGGRLALDVDMSAEIDVLLREGGMSR